MIKFSHGARSGGIVGERGRSCLGSDAGVGVGIDKKIKAVAGDATRREYVKPV